MKENSKKLENDKIYKEIGDKIRIFREDKGYTISQLCDQIYKKYAVKLNPNLIGKIERAETRIQIKTFLLLCDFFQININATFIKHSDLQINESEEYNKFFFSDKEGLELIKNIHKLKNDIWKKKIVSVFINSIIPHFENILIEETHVPKTFIRAAAPDKDE